MILIWVEWTNGVLRVSAVVKIFSFTWKIIYLLLTRILVLKLRQMNAFDHQNHVREMRKANGATYNQP